MARYPQLIDGRGSLRWTQRMVNEHPDVLAAAIGSGPIDWCSPLTSDACAEYRDDAFLQRLGAPTLETPLSDFWPKLGPQWAGTDSAPMIQAALEETALALGASPGTDWSRRFYQYANRLAHAYFLNVRNHVPTRLVFLYFIGDPDVDGPQSRREWQAAIDVLHEALGVRGRIPKYVSDAFIDVRGALPVVA